MSFNAHVFCKLLSDVTSGGQKKRIHIQAAKAFEGRKRSHGRKLEQHATSTVAQCAYYGKWSNYGTMLSLTLLMISRVAVDNSFFMGTRVTPSARGVSFSTILSTHSLKAGMRVFR